MKMKKFLGLVVASLMSATAMNAQSTITDMEVLTVNEHVTTIITASEPIRFVDISTDMVAGDQPIENTIRLKPKEAKDDGEIMGIVTIVTERYRTQYGLIYTSEIHEAVTDKEIILADRRQYNNPAVTMSTEDMYAYAHRISSSPANYRDVSYKSHGMRMRLNNLYSIGDYFFVDYSIENATNIKFDIDEIRLKLNDKKITKATNNQTIDIKPTLILNRTTSFKKGYRNVVVIKKMTFPNDKILTIEMSEKQISGRTLKLDINYEDVLAADSFDETLLNVQ